MKVDTIIVLGGGINPEGKLPGWVLSRLEKANKLYQNRISSTILVSGKGRDNYPITEAEAMSAFLQQHGIPAVDILTEHLSTDTLQNAYFSRVIHTDPLEFHSATVVTNEFHFKRSKLIFDWVFDSYDLQYETVENDGIPIPELEMRAFTENQLIEFYSEMFNSISKGDLQGFHEFIFNPYNKFHKRYMELSRELKDKMVLY